MYPRYEYRNEPVSVHIHRDSPGCATRFHKQVECLFVLEGEIEAVLDGETYQLSEGDLYIVFPNLLHSLSPCKAGFECVIADPELFRSYSDILTHKKPVCPVLRRDEVPEVVPILFREILRVKRSENYANPLAVLKGYLNALLGEITEVCPMTERDSDNDLVQRLMLYIYQNYTREITLDDLAKNLNYSKFYISHIISETFHCNFRPLINSYRISMAQHLLLCSSKPVSTIAYECGFKNQSSFNRIFLKSCGVTPTAYRKSTEEGAERPEITVR